MDGDRGENFIMVYFGAKSYTIRFNISFISYLRVRSAFGRWLNLWRGRIQHREWACECRQVLAEKMHRHNLTSATLRIWKHVCFYVVAVRSCMGLCMKTCVFYMSRQYDSLLFRAVEKTK